MANNPIEQKINITGNFEQKFQEYIKYMRDAGKITDKEASQMTKDFKSISTSMNKVDKSSKELVSAFDKLSSFSQKAFFPVEMAQQFTGALQSVVEIAKESVAVYSEQQLSLQKLELALKNNGIALSEMATIQQSANQVQDTTGLQNEEYINQVTRMVNSSMSLAEAQRVVNIGLDVARATNQDLETVIDQVRDARTGSLTALEDYISAEKAELLVQEKEKNGYDEITHFANVYAVTLNELETRYEGNAELMSQNQGGMDKLANTYKDFQASIGKLLLPAVQEITNALDTLLKDTMEGTDSTEFQEMFKSITNIFSNLWSVIGDIYDSFKSLWDFLGGSEVLQDVLWTIEKITEAMSVWSGWLSDIYGQLDGIGEEFSVWEDIIKGGLLPAIKQVQEAEKQMNLMAETFKVNQDETVKSMGLSLEVQKDLATEGYNAAKSEEDKLNIIKNVIQQRIAELELQKKTLVAQNKAAMIAKRAEELIRDAGAFAFVGKTRGDYLVEALNEVAPAYVRQLNDIETETTNLNNRLKALTTPTGPTTVRTPTNTTGGGGGTGTTSKNEYEAMNRQLDQQLLKYQELNEVEQRRKEQEIELLNYQDQLESKVKAKTLLQSEANLLEAKFKDLQAQEIVELEKAINLKKSIIEQEAVWAEQKRQQQQQDFNSELSYQEQILQLRLDGEDIEADRLELAHQNAEYTKQRTIELKAMGYTASERLDIITRELAITRQQLEEEERLKQIEDDRNKAIARLAANREAEAGERQRAMARDEYDRELKLRRELLDASQYDTRSREIEIQLAADLLELEDRLTMELKEKGFRHDEIIERLEKEKQILIDNANIEKAAIPGTEPGGNSGTDNKPPEKSPFGWDDFITQDWDEALKNLEEQLPTIVNEMAQTASKIIGSAMAQAIDGDVDGEAIGESIGAMVGQGLTAVLATYMGPVGGMIGGLLSPIIQKGLGKLGEYLDPEIKKINEYAEKTKAIQNTLEKTKKTYESLSKYFETRFSGEMGLYDIEKKRQKLYELTGKSGEDRIKLAMEEKKILEEIALIEYKSAFQDEKGQNHAKMMLEIKNSELFAVQENLKLLDEEKEIRESILDIQLKQSKAAYDLLDAEKETIKDLADQQQNVIKNLLSNYDDYENKEEFLDKMLPAISDYIGTLESGLLSGIFTETDIDEAYSWIDNVSGGITEQLDQVNSDIAAKFLEIVGTAQEIYNNTGNHVEDLDFNMLLNLDDGAGYTNFEQWAATYLGQNAFQEWQDLLDRRADLNSIFGDTGAVTFFKNALKSIGDTILEGKIEELNRNQGLIEDEIDLAETKKERLSLYDELLTKQIEEGEYLEKLKQYYIGAEASQKTIDEVQERINANLLEQQTTQKAITDETNSQNDALDKQDAILTNLLRQREKLKLAGDTTGIEDSNAAIYSRLVELGTSPEDIQKILANLPGYADGGITSTLSLAHPEEAIFNPGATSAMADIFGLGNLKAMTQSAGAVYNNTSSASSNTTVNMGGITVNGSNNATVTADAIWKVVESKFRQQGVKIA